MRIFLNSPMNFEPDATRRFFSALGFVAAAFLALTLAACGSPRPIKYYQLTYPTTAPSPGAPLNVTLLVRAFDSSNLFKEEGIVYSVHPPELSVYDQQRWVAAPVDMLQDALVRGLRSSGRFRSVMTVRGEGGGDYALAGHLYEFGEVDSPEIVARLSYTVRLRDRKTGLIVWTHTYNHDEPASAKTVLAVVAAMDTNVQRSVQEVQAALGEYFAAHPAS
ncbi:MAG: ABC-type transport auxiliary lipoprotein family protein [Bryobacteraceae bacterium]